MRFFFPVCAILFLMLIPNVSAQISENAEPFSSIYKLSPITQFEEMPYFNKASMVDEDKERKTHGLKVNRFAKMFNVGFHPFNSGTWDETGGGKVWRLGIHSSDAYSLYLVFGEFNLAQGVKMFIYNINYSSVAGAFTNKNNNKFNKLAVAPIDGDILIVELDIPSGTDDFGKLLLNKVGHDYRNAFGSSRLKSKSGVSDTCEVDINCDLGAPWQKEKRAVCRMIVDADYCTGTLINNVENLKIPYLLTAYHCVSTQQIAETGVYLFNYERINCNGTATTVSQSLSGAELISTTNHLLDFALLKLNNYPSPLVQPYFVGWDTRTDAPQNGVCIHHPQGDVKKISVTYHPIVTGSFGENYDLLSHWQVQRWDRGATEGGSSGSPIFNNLHRLVGTLTGGGATCVDPRDDYFTKFNLDWDKYPDSANQVKCWLNPTNKNVSFVNGLDPYNDTVGLCNTFWNIPTYETIKLNKDGLNWGYLSGHNSAGFSQFAEKFINSSIIKIKGIYLNVGKAAYSNLFSTITLKIWEGDTYPTAEIYSKPQYIKTFTPNSINYVGFDTIVSAAGNFFVGYEVNYTAQQDTFAVYQSVDRGATGPSTMYVFNDGSWKGIDMASFPAIYSSLSIGLIGCDGSVEVPKSKTIKVFPNPFINFGQIDLPIGVTIDNVIAYDCVGRSVPLKFNVSNNVLTMYPGFLADGIYVLELKTRSKPLFARFVIIRK